MTDNSGFSIFALDQPRYIRTIRQKLKEIRDNRCEDLISGRASDWPDYQRQVGFLEGLEEALRVCDDIEKAERA